MTASRQNKKIGFTLLELIIVLAVMTILSGVLIPIVKQILDSAKVNRVVSLVDTMTNACKRFYKDTHQFATENPNADATILRNHSLAYDQNGEIGSAGTPISGWNGPYIDGPLLNSALPFENATISLLPTARGYNASGYQLAGAGPVTLSDSGAELLITGVDATWITKLEEAIDKNAFNNPSTTGRMIYDSGGGTVSIFLFDPFGKH